MDAFHANEVDVFLLLLLFGCCCLGDGEGSILPDFEGFVVVVALVESVVGEIGIDPGNDLCK